LTFRNEGAGGNIAPADKRKEKTERRFRDARIRLRVNLHHLFLSLGPDENFGRGLKKEAPEKTEVK